MTTIDNRIIRMTFDNAKFERDVAQSIKTIDGLKAAMDFSKAKKNFADLSSMGKMTATLDTRQFSTKIAEAMGDIQRVQNKLEFGSSSRSLTDLADKVNSFSLAGMAGQVGGISKRFLALATIGITALAQIASQAVRTG